MSAKWIRSKQWDDQFFPAWAWPAKAILRAFSSIWLAVVLLTLLSIYGLLASVPIGLLAKIPTVLFYGLTLLATIALVGVLPVIIMRRLWRPGDPAQRNWRFAITIVGSLVLLFGAFELWYLVLWPRLHFDPIKGEGVRFFSDFIDRYQATTLRRLPGMEMSELEFYDWWPLRLILLAFVTNMVVATVRRIEFSFVNLGVLTVHTGIVTIALGSAYYSGLKKEGDTLLIAGGLAPDNTTIPGPPVGKFYDNTSVVLILRQSGRIWEQWPLTSPRYNEYNLLAAGTDTVINTIGKGNPPGLDRGRTLSTPLAPYNPAATGVDPDISIRLVGYAPYVELVDDWARAPLPADAKPNPVRMLRVELRDQANDGGPPPLFYLLPALPHARLGENDGIGIEYTIAMPASRWADLSIDLPTGSTGRPAAHAIVVEVPQGQGQPPFRGIYPAEPGRAFEIGPTGFRITTKELRPTPPFPIVTEGYRNAQSSLAVVRVERPGESSPGYDRWVYHRFPEISQDFVDDPASPGAPRRRPADPGIRITYIDASKLQVYVDEAPGAPDGAIGQARMLVRLPGQPARITEGLVFDQPVGVMPGLDVRINRAWAHAAPTQTPIVVPEHQRDREQVGNHGKAAIALEISAAGSDGSRHTQVVWVPFARYHGIDPKLLRKVDLPGGRSLELSFGRQAHQLPGFMLRLVDFQMISYEHRGAPRDYQSLVQVIPVHDAQTPPSFKPYVHVTKLNAPLQAPFMWSDERSWLANVGGTLLSRLDPGQFKFSQAGWDAEGWRQSQEAADRGEVPRPMAQFTILGVGNNPGIHVIAFGGVLMSIGIPWAFYVKPWILKRRAAKLKAMMAAAGRTPKAPSAASPPAFAAIDAPSVPHTAGAQA